MSSKNYELRYLECDKLAEQGIYVPYVQPYSFLDGSMPEINDEMRNGLDVKTEVGSPVFTIINISEESRDGSTITIVELEFNRIDPTPYSKVPQNN